MKSRKQRNVVNSYFKKFTVISGILFGIFVIVLAFISSDKLPAFLFAYLISYAFTAGNFFVMSKIDLQDNSRFFNFFGWSFAVRFTLAIAAIIIGLQTLNYHQFFFTVSFIFSYICHSVIEIIFLNKILETDT